MKENVNKAITSFEDKTMVTLKAVEIFAGDSCACYKQGYLWRVDVLRVKVADFLRRCFCWWTFQPTSFAGETTLKLNLQFVHFDRLWKFQLNRLRRVLEKEKGVGTFWMFSVKVDFCHRNVGLLPTWSEFQQVSSFPSNMNFFPNCFTALLRTELTLQQVVFIHRSFLPLADAVFKMVFDQTAPEIG